MPDKESTSYTFVFALIVCIVCSFLLALVSEGLRPLKEQNVENDIKKNILKVVDLREPLADEATPDQIKKIYTEKIQGVVIDAKGNMVDGMSPLDIEEGDGYYPPYI